METPPVRLRVRKLELFRALGYTPHPAQLLVHKSQAPRRVVACGVRFGKSTIGAYEAILALLTPRDQARGWICAPTYDLTSRVFRKVVEILQAHMPRRVLHFDPREHVIRVANLGGGVSELRAKSTDRPVGLLGEALDFLIVDEAAKVRDDVWCEHLAPRLLDRGGWALLLSTPDGGGWFHGEHVRGTKKRRDPAYACWQFPSAENPFLSKDLIEEERTRLSPEVFRAQYLGEFVNVPIIPCELCHGPREGARCALVVHGYDEPPTCPECGQLVNDDGETAVALWPNGKRHCMVIRIEKPVYGPQLPRAKMPDGIPDPPDSSDSPDFGLLEMRTEG